MDLTPEVPERPYIMGSQRRVVGRVCTGASAPFLSKSREAFIVSRTKRKRPDSYSVRLFLSEPLPSSSYALCGGVGTDCFSLFAASEWTAPL